MSDVVLRGTLVLMAPALIEQASELREFVGSVSRMRDAVGVLSITIGIEPGVVSGGTPGWEIAVENDFARLRHDRSVGPLVTRRSEETSTRLAELLDPTTAGRGRALYVALESGELHEAALQPALPPGARLGIAAHVLPLLVVVDEAEPAGLVSASRDAIAVLESELGMVGDVDRIELEPTIGDWWPEMKGPARANPLRGQHTVSQRDRYARRLAAAYRHTLDEASDAIRALARERCWTRAVLAGDPRTIDVLDEVLRADGVVTTTIAANLEGLRAEDAVRRLEDAYNSRDYSVLPDLIRDDLVAHTAGSDQAPQNHAGLQMINENAYTAFPDKVTEIVEAFGEGDRVVARVRNTGTNTGGLPWFGIAANDGKVDVEWIQISRHDEAGKIAETWSQMEVAKLMQQLGAMPGPEGM